MESLDLLLKIVDENFDLVTIETLLELLFRRKWSCVKNFRQLIVTNPFGFYRLRWLLLR